MAVLVAWPRDLRRSVGSAYILFDITRVARVASRSRGIPVERIRIHETTIVHRRYPSSLHRHRFC